MSSDLAASAVGKTGGVRKYGRVYVDTSIRVCSNSRPPVLGRTIDIGCGGLAFYAPLELAEGDIIKLEFELPYSEMRFAVTAMVRHRSGFRYGMEFQQLTPRRVRGDRPSHGCSLSFAHP